MLWVPRCLSVSVFKCNISGVNDEYTESPLRNFAPILRDADLSSRAKIEALEGLIREAMREPYAWPFLEPVDRRDVSRDNCSYPKGSEDN